MNKVAIIIVSLILALVVVSGGCTQIAPATSSNGSETIKPTNSESGGSETVKPTKESASRIAELEARIRELEAENQRLLTENQELSSENQGLVTENREVSDNLARVTSQLQAIDSLITSSSYRQTLSRLPGIQTDANDLATFLGGLPDLPPPPPGLTVSQIDDAINKARHLRELLRDLPDLPPSGWPFFIPFPQQLLALDEVKDEIIKMTKWMEDLEDLPDFLRVAGDFGDLRSDMISYLTDVATTASDTKSILEEIKIKATP